MGLYIYNPSSFLVVLNVNLLSDLPWFRIHTTINNKILSSFNGFLGTYPFT